MPNNHPTVIRINELLAKLEESPSADKGIELANEIITLFGNIPIKSVEGVFESSIELPNAERYDSWFQPHPIFKSDRACFDLADAPLLQAKFYWLKKHSRQIIAGGVHFTPNYEDEEFTHNEKYKVGLDFFLSPSGKSLQVVLSNRGNLRIVELSGRLNNTQKEIFEKWIDAGSLKSQEALHTTLWESFKLKSVNQKFYDGVSNSFTELLQHLKSIDKDEEEAKLFASRLLGRLLFCWFLRKKGIIDESVGYFNAQGADATAYYKQSLERLFFLTLNTPIDDRDELTKQHKKVLFPELLVDDQPSLFKTDQKTPYLNGGLFEPHLNDWYKDDSLTLPEGFFTNLYSHFEEFNFTTDESSPEYEQIAIDPEMLGRVFESLLATQVDETGQQARKAKGAFYTPREIVSYMCKESLRNYLYNAVSDDEKSIKESIDSLLDISDSEWAKSKSNTLRDKVKDNRTQIIDALDAVTILDPACGSGAYPMGMLQLMLKTYERLESRFDPYKTKLSVIQNNIFGVDIEPMAVEISRLRAWLSLIVDEDDPRSVDPLPNLDFKFVCANSLIPLDKEMGLFSDNSLHQKLKDIRTKYFNARKKHTKKALQDEYDKLTSSEQTSLISDDNRTKQLKSFEPFKNSKSSQFFDSEHMFGISHGFDILIGNPPYKILTKNNTDASILNDYKNIFVSIRKAQSKNLFTLFIERGIKLAARNGSSCYIVPEGLFATRSYNDCVTYMNDSGSVKFITTFTEMVFENATTGNLVFLHQNNSNFEPIKFHYNKEKKLELIKNEENLIVSKIVSKRCTNLDNELQIFKGMVVQDRASVISESKLGKVDTFLLGKSIGKWHVDKPYFANYSELNIIGGTKVLSKYNIYPRIVVRRTGNSLCAAMINEPTLTESTLYSLSLKPTTSYDLYSILALLNSKLYTYLIRMDMVTNKQAFPQILMTDLKELPLPNLDIKLSNTLSALAKEVLNDHKTPIITDDQKTRAIDELVYGLYELSPEEIAVIESEIGN